MHQPPSPTHVEVTPAAKVDVVVDAPGFACPRIGHIRVQHGPVSVAGHVKQAVTGVLIGWNDDVLEFLRHDDADHKCVVARVEIAFCEREGDCVVPLNGSHGPVGRGGRPLGREGVGHALQGRHTGNRPGSVPAVGRTGWRTLGTRLPFHVTGVAAASDVFVGHLDLKRDWRVGVDVLAFGGAEAVGHRKVARGRRSRRQGDHE